MSAIVEKLKNINCDDAIRKSNWRSVCPQRVYVQRYVYRGPDSRVAPSTQLLSGPQRRKERGHHKVNGTSSRPLAQAPPPPHPRPRGEALSMWSRYQIVGNTCRSNTFEPPPGKHISLPILISGSPLARFPTLGVWRGTGVFDS